MKWALKLNKTQGSRIPLIDAIRAPGEAQKVNMKSKKAEADCEHNS